MSLLPLVFVKRHCNQHLGKRLSLTLKLLKHLLDHSSKPSTGFRDEHRLVVVNLFLHTSKAKISSTWTDVGALEDQLPEDECHREETDHCVGQEEPHCRPISLEENVVTSS